MRKQHLGWFVSLMGIVSLVSLGCDGDHEEPGLGASGQGTAGAAGQLAAGASGQAAAGASGQAAAGAAGQAAAGAAGQAAAGAGGENLGGGSGQAGGAGGADEYTGALVPVDGSQLDTSYPYQSCSRQARLARAGQEVAAIYSESGKVWLQRLSSGGQALGGPAALGDAVTDGQGSVLPPSVSLASDGTSYVGCWDTGVVGYDVSKAQVTCVRVPVGAGASTPLFTESGARPSVAWRSEGFALVTQRPTGVFAVRDLDPTSSTPALEVPVPSESQPAYSSLGSSGALLAATTSGFALVTLAHGELHRLDPAFKVVGEPLDLDGVSGPYDVTPQMVALGDTVAVGVPFPYEFRLSIAAPGQPAAHVSFNGGGKNGTSAALATEDSLIGVFLSLSTPAGSFLIHHSIDPLQPPTKAVDPRKNGSGFGQTNWGDRCSFTTVAVEGATLVAIPAAHGLEVVRFAQP